MIEDAARRRRPAAAGVGIGMVVRPAMPADHDPIVAGLDLSASTSRLLAKDLAGALPRHCLVAEDGGEIVGFAMTTRQPDEVHLLDIAVAASRRRQGVARHLLARLAAMAMADGATAMTLEVRTSNRPARSLYARVGFVDHGVRPGYYRDGEDAAILWHDDLAGLVEIAGSIGPARVATPPMTAVGRLAAAPANPARMS
ncbi:MAG TPA: ribosomal protein S18-alanine N-acetyltransferase [Nitriliruptoraceae bacterium]|nr:ribosomal protein S18-alanine N-acetyltransferase [Nitriliruptoraceae bacterium]